MRRWLIAGLVSLASILPGYPAQADLAPLEITEEDASPSTFPYQIRFSNGSVTDNGDGTTSVSTGSGGAPTGASYVVISSNGTLTDERIIQEQQGIDLVDTGPGGHANLSVDLTEFSAVTVGSGSFTTFTFDSGTTDPVITSGDGTLTITPGGSDLIVADDVELQDATPHLRLTDTTAAQDDFELWADQSIAYLSNLTDGAQIWRTTQANGFQTIGRLTTEGGADLNGQIDARAATSVLLPRALSIGGVSYTFPPANGSNGQFLTEDGSGGLTWTTSSGSGDITSVGDVASGAAFDGTQGTTITFNNAGGDATLSYDGSELTSNVTFEVSGSAPTVLWTDTTASQDDFEAYIDANVWYLTNLTDGAVIVRTTQTNGLNTVGVLTTEGGVNLRGTVDARAATVVALVEQESKTIFDPDTVQTTTDAIPLFEVDAYNYPFGITIHQVKLSVNASASPAYNLEEWTSPSDGSPATLLNMQLSSQTERTWRSFADASIAAGSFVFVDLDTTALNWAIITVWYSANTS